MEETLSEITMMALTENNKRVLLFGNVIIDRYYEVENYPQSGQDTTILKSYNKVGGCAINVASSLKNLGMIPYIVSNLGDDENGHLIMHYLQSFDIPTHCIRVEAGRNTGYCLTILDKNGERTFFTFKGCEIEFSSDNFPDITFQNTKFAYVTGYCLLDAKSATSILEFIEKIKHGGCRILFDPGSLVTDMNTSQLSAMLNLSDLIIPNEHELKLIEEKFGLTRNAYDWLHDCGCQYVIVKKGVGGVEVHSPGEDMKMPAFKTKSVDTNGAGDSFIGGLIYGLSHDLGFNRAIELANACGAYITTVKGPHASFSIEDICNFIEKNKMSLPC